MALSQTTLTTTYYKTKTVAKLLSSDEAGSGIVYLQLSNDPTPTKNYLIDSNVYASGIAGTIRTLTNQFYDTSTGLVKITGSSFAANDIAMVTGIKYV